jgi:nitroreductase
MDTKFTTVAENIKSRRSVKAQAMNGKKIPNGEIAALLELADWAPNHGNTEPWRFVVYEDTAKFCHPHAELYKSVTEEDKFESATFNKLFSQGDLASHIIVAVMKRGHLPKIPAFEEIAAASAAVQNILLAATSLNIASFWSTGGMALKPELKKLLNFGDDDQVMAVIYLGYSDEHPEGKRMIPIEEKIRWVK